MYEKIVVGFDGSARAKGAVKQAADLATAIGSALHLVTAINKNDKTHTFGESSDKQSMTVSEIAEKNLNFLAESMPDLEVTVAAVPGSPAKVLVEQAEATQADLILVGNRHVQGLSRVLGSVAEDVAHKAPCAVLIVKTA